MTTITEAEQTVLTHWVTSWGATTAYVFEEEELPAGVVRGQASWVRLVVVDRPSDQESLGPVGGRKYRRRAWVAIQIFTPSNQGVAGALQLADQARDVFEGLSLSGLDFVDGQVNRVGDVPPEYQVNVIVPFDYEQTK